MAKTTLGFDIGNYSLKIAVAQGDSLRLYEERLPENMMENSAVAMPNAFVDFLRRVKKQLALPRGECALVLPENQVICQLVKLPRMEEKQLLLNLPYEFSDFITGDPTQYFCDYAVCEPLPGDGADEITVMAAAMAKQQIQQYVRMFSQAGLRLRMLLPQEMALLALTARQPGGKNAAPEYCFVDLAQTATRITILQGDRLLGQRSIPLGGRALDHTVADLLGTDLFLASAYKEGNYQEVLQNPACTEVISQIAVEILKVINFYQFTYRASSLQGIYVSGGGAGLLPMRQAIADALGLPALPAAGLLPGCENPQKAPSCLFAAGVALAGREDA